MTTTPQACPICQKPYVFSARVNALVPICFCLQERARAEAQEERFVDYKNSIDQRVLALGLGPIKAHERIAPEFDWRHNVVLIGPAGRGKTSLLKRAAYAATLAGYRVRGGRVVELLSDLKNPDNLQATMDRVLGGTMLVLDDLDKALGTQYELERLLFIVDRYWSHDMPVLTSMNRDPDDVEKRLAGVRGLKMDEEAEALLSRLMANAQVVTVEGPDRRMQREAE